MGNLSMAELTLALGQKWRSMPEGDGKMAIYLALDTLLQEIHGVEDTYEWTGFVRSALVARIQERRAMAERLEGE